MAKSRFAAGFAGFLIGVVTGLGIAAGAAVFITKSPLPFVEKVDKVTADVDPAAKLAGNVDPNARLNTSSMDAPAAAPSGSVKTVTVADTEAPTRDAAGKAVEPGQVTPVTYWVQIGAYNKRMTQRPTLLVLPCRALAPLFCKPGPFGASASAPLMTGNLLRKLLTAFLTRG